MNEPAEIARVYIINRDSNARDAHRGLLESLGYRTETFADAASFLARANLEAAGCVVLDVALPDQQDGEPQAQLQAVSSPLALVFLTLDDDIDTAVAAMRREAAGYLLKPVREQQLLDVVNGALRQSLAAALRNRARRGVLAHLARLTPREHDILNQLAEGAHYDVVSRRLGISKRTVEAHRRRIMEKMGARTLPQLLRQLAQVGWPGSSALRSPPGGPGSRPGAD